MIVAQPRDLFTAANLKKFEVPWDQKVPTVFFRGTATGGGVTTATNQRLHAAQICFDWSNSSNYPLMSGQISNTMVEQVGTLDQNKDSIDSASVKREDSYYPFLDAKITGWNMRDKKIANGKMTFLRKDHFPFEGDRKKNFVEIYKQGTYKYLMYIEGHCAACRYGFMMQLGSVILKVSCVTIIIFSCFILFYVMVFKFILYYYILCYSISFYFILFYFILFYSILFYFMVFCDVNFA